MRAKKDSVISPVIPLQYLGRHPHKVMNLGIMLLRNKLKDLRHIISSPIVLPLKPLAQTSHIPSKPALKSTLNLFKTRNFGGILLTVSESMLDTCKIRLARIAISALKTKRNRNNKFISRYFAVLATTAAGCSISLDKSHLVSYADNRPIENVEATIQKHPTNRDLNALREMLTFIELIKQKISNWLTLLLRSIFLLMNFTPAVATTPLLIFGDGSSSVWWNIMRDAIRRSGPCTTKFAQWLATRPDLFPLTMCENLQCLQTNAYVHSHAESERALAAAFGENWRDQITLFQPPASRTADAKVGSEADSQPQHQQHQYQSQWSKSSENEHVMLGSGCVAQVLEGRINDRPVAIKIVHPGVRGSIEADIKLLQFLCWAVETIVPGARDSFSLSDCTEEFASLMTSQLDLTIEADNLDRFRRHFSDPNQWRKLRITFPQPVRPYVTRDVLVETFEEGRLISEFLHDDDDRMTNNTNIPVGKTMATTKTVAAKSTPIASTNTIRDDLSTTANANSPSTARTSSSTTTTSVNSSRTKVVSTDRMGSASDSASHSDSHSGSGISLRSELRKDLATEVLNTILKMVFEDNFVHADLHPGNILLREKRDTRHQTNKLQDDKQHRNVPIHGDFSVDSGSKYSKNWELSLIDAGLVASLGPLDRQNFIDLFSAVVRNDGERVGKLIIERSRGGGSMCVDPEGFSRAIGELVRDVHGSGLALGQIGVGALLQKVLLLCYQYRVKLEPRFASVVIAVGVLEGLGRRLDPNVDILKIAAPYVLKASL